jgi:flagellar biosynthesis/type III secretory pathway chaperone
VYQITQLLTEELQLTQQLVSILKEEQAILLNNEIESLQVITENKTQLVNTLFLVDQTRLDVLKEANLADQNNNMLKLLDRIAEPELQLLWQTLLSTTSEAKDLNNNNGLVLNRLAGNTQNALAILRSQCPNDTILYGKDGQNTTTTPSLSTFS